MRKLIAVLILMFLAISAGPASAQPDATTPCSGLTKTGPYQHVIFWILENHSLSQSRGSMPYLDSVANKCGYMTHEQAISHPSLPNYLALTGGSTFGVTDDAGPSSHKIGSPSIFSQLAGSWRGFHQSMPKNCDLTNAGEYIVHHNPAAYYTSIRSGCQTKDLPITQLSSELADEGQAPKYGFIVPDNCHNGHKNPCAGGGTLAGQAKQADDYLQTELSVVLNSPTYEDGHTLVVVTFDEGHSAQTVYTVLISPYIPKGMVYNQTATHYSLLRYAESQLGVPCLKAACNAPALTGPGLAVKR